MKTSRRLLPAAALLCLGLASGCEDPTFSDAGATGFMVRDASGILVTVDGSRVSGSISVAFGENRTLHAQLRGPGGTVAEPSMNEAVWLRFGGEGLVEWSSGYSGPHTGTRRGRGGGSTSMTLELVRGGVPVHASPPIPVVVTP